MERSRKKKAESGSNKLFRLVLDNQGLSVQEIAEKLGWTKAKTNRMLTTLEKKGWIVRKVFATAQPKIIAKPNVAAQHLGAKFTRLATWKAKLQDREKELFEKCVSAQMEGDTTKATMYANQCSEIRKMIGLVTGTEEVLSGLSTPEN